MPVYGRKPRKTPEETKGAILVDFVKKHGDWWDRVMFADPEDLFNRLGDIKRDVNVILRKHYPWMD
jgi:hypothetical protein|tara:strand:- start:220 stop:417 length:198 start_codon:yes stop_codon:yes gene_type:complete